MPGESEDAGDQQEQKKEASRALARHQEKKREAAREKKTEESEGKIKEETREERTGTKQGERLEEVLPQMDDGRSEESTSHFDGVFVFLNVGTWRLTERVMETHHRQKKQEHSVAA